MIFLINITFMIIFQQPISIKTFSVDVNRDYFLP